MFCEECGEPFIRKEETSVETSQCMAANSSAHAILNDLPPNDTSPDIADRPAPAWVPGFGTPDQVILHLQDSNRRFEIDMFDAPVILGRADPRIGFEPEVELTPYDALKLGVSRRHAIISWSNNGVTIEDLDSSNGTFLNGHRLSPHFRRLLRDGDLVALGELVMRVYFK